MPQHYSTPVYRREIPSWFWDALAASGIILSAAGLLWVPWLFWLPIAVLVWGMLVEPRILTVKRVTEGEGKGSLRIVFISDIHVGPFKREGWVRKVVRRTNALRPDIVLLGGDLIYDASSDPTPLLGFKDFRAPLGVVGILGNHDYHYGHRKTDEIMKRAGVDLLQNRAHRFSHGGKSYAVVGITDDWHAETDFGAAMREVEEGDRVIMLIHNPDLAPHAARYRPDLMFSGHVHGGQIRLPLLGAVPRLPHHLGRRYDRGRFEFDGVPLIIGQGVGESGPRARLFCPPQILEVTLRL